MADTAAPIPTTQEQEEFLSRIRRSNAETEKFIAEARKLSRDAAVIPYTALFSGLTAGAALFGAGIAFAKVFGGP